MPNHAMTTHQVAAELGRTSRWVKENWKKLAETVSFPEPVLSEGSLVWSAAQFYAWQDRNLNKKQRAAAVAYRAAFEAACANEASLFDKTLGDAKDRLSTRYLTENVN